MPLALSRLSSRQHPIVQAFRRCAAGPPVDATVLLDGAHVIREALAAGVPVTALLVSTTFLTEASEDDRAVVSRAARGKTTIYEATAAVLDAASPVRTASGIVALAEWTPTPIASTFTPLPALVVGLVDVQDPGNVGGVIRSADALGATGVVTLDATANPGGWKALRGAMGSTFRIPVGRAHTEALLSAARALKIRVVATVAGAAMPFDDLDLRPPTLVLLGNEGAGLPSHIAEMADVQVTVPMRSDVSSLNVGVTAALLLYEARRQRGAHDKSASQKAGTTSR